MDRVDPHTVGGLKQIQVDSNGGQCQVEVYISRHHCISYQWWQPVPVRVMMPSWRFGRLARFKANSMDLSRTVLFMKKLLLSYVILGMNEIKYSGQCYQCGQDPSGSDQVMVVLN